MFDSNFQNNTSCTFAEQAISFLYGEITAQEKAAFESHLLNCMSCAEDIAGFKTVHSSVLEWRSLDFAALELPAIEIPYENVRSFDKLKTDSNFSSFRFLDFRRFFSPFSVAAFAAILVFVGLAFFAIKFSSRLETAKSEDKNANSIQAMPTSDLQTATGSTGHNVGIEDSKISMKKAFEPAISETENNHRNSVNAPKTARKITTARFADASGKTGKTLNSAATSFSNKTVNNDYSTQSRSINAKKLPKLNNLVEEKEDKSLRLAELFDDAR